MKTGTHLQTLIQHHDCLVQLLLDGVSVLEDCVIAHDDLPRW